MQQTIEQIHSQYVNHNDGEIASYIPELTKSNPQHFGIAIATEKGEVFEIGDSRVEFTIQSISKVFTYGLAIEAFGLEKVMKHVGVEPSGDAFNSIILEKSGVVIRAKLLRRSTSYSLDSLQLGHFTFTSSVGP